MQNQELDKLRGAEIFRGLTDNTAAEARRMATEEMVKLRAEYEKLQTRNAELEAGNTETLKRMGGDYQRLQREHNDVKEALQSVTKEMMDIKARWTETTAVNERLR